MHTQDEKLVILVLKYVKKPFVCKFTWNREWMGVPF